MTAWAVLGSYDWCTLVTRDAGSYEPGVFDVRSGRPRATLLTDAVRRIVDTGELPYDGRGWWAQPDRFTFEPSEAESAGEEEFPVVPVSSVVTAGLTAVA